MSWPIRPSIRRRRKSSSGAGKPRAPRNERTTSMFLNELCDLLEVPRPDLAGPDDEKNAYALERAVPFPNPDGATAVKRIDLYKRDCFVLGANSEIVVYGVRGTRNSK
jgi:hypothetical protein